MSARAEWHLASGVQTDPFGKMVYSSGLSIDLEGSEEELAESWVRLLKVEQRLATAGLVCELKDGGQDCLTCPVATLDVADRRNRLCRLGKDQSTVEQLCQALADARRAPIEELASYVGGLAELAELPDELAELLTSVGL